MFSYRLSFALAHSPLPDLPVRARAHSRAGLIFPPTGSRPMVHRT
ncbi:hypothetical protein XBI1_1530009 [Xenorhabdus bovienii str. Intermedium]|uniref:Uncharacterized protein n=1 Tax=Xenorhabdus bovienii str. Intermedium TaxID=1379677 RepID=A0A077QGS4_XENBV|nr:hypothetical protein XBI1_1530009 [Xenorhabdus bovienii str. Intermedium]